jgi:hypothetical protein
MLLLLGLCLAVSSETIYDYARNYTDAFMTGYENPDYVFPYENCLTKSTQTGITDKIIGMLIFVSRENWAQVELVKQQLYVYLNKAAEECDLDQFITNFKDNESTSVLIWIVRLWWNSVLLYRNCGEFSQYLASDPYEAFYYLGKCARFIYPNS